MRDFLRVLINSVIYFATQFNHCCTSLSFINKYVAVIFLQHIYIYIYIYIYEGWKFNSDNYLYSTDKNRYMFRSFTVLHCSHQHCIQPVASDVEVTRA